MPATKQLRLSFPERQLLLPLTDPVDQPSNIGEDLVDVVDLNADEFIVVLALPPADPGHCKSTAMEDFAKQTGVPIVQLAHDHDAEIDF
ncbi:MAG: hypothetical protein Unbinned1606contig1000_24 [Prokaryotic dsDNA virus sp.]|nr:MAG: hypothetical protein Unbinned1606contig1000_24 [Prokaryotic dsDNA virus sp.]|tara:strand:- start:3835 stop:4101 length:267 start_codon:yes stop_codon:yes gene_type:complete